MIVLEKGPYRLEHTAICIGKFDGLHRGHRLLIDGIGSYKHKQNVLFTFSFPNTASIYSEREKRYLAEQLGTFTLTARSITGFRTCRRKRFCRKSCWNNAART